MIGFLAVCAILILQLGVFSALMKEHWEVTLEPKQEYKWVPPRHFNCRCQIPEANLSCNSEHIRPTKRKSRRKKDYFDLVD